MASSNALDRAARAFARSKLIYWEDLKVDERPGVGGRSAYCVVPKSGRTNAVFEICCTDRSTTHVVFRDEKGQATESSLEEIDARVDKDGVLYACDGKAVLRGFDGKLTWSMEVPSGKSRASIGAVVFGRMFPCLLRYGVDMSDLRFVVEAKCGKDIVRVARVTATDEINRGTFVDAVRRLLVARKRERIDERCVVLKKPRVTVVEDDSRMITRDVRGVTHVPSRFPHEGENPRCSGGYWRDRERCNCCGCKQRRAIEKLKRRWDDLIAEAAKQKAAMDEYFRELNVRIAEARGKVSVPDAEVDRAMKNLQATVRRVGLDDVAEGGREDAVPVTLEADESDDTWSGDTVPDRIIRKYNAKLKVKSFCGQDFGVTHGGSSGVLKNKFRLFDTYTVSRTNLHRVDRISIQAQLENGAEPASARKELGMVVVLLEKKYGVRFDVCDSSDSRMEQAAENEDIELRVTGEFSGRGRMRITFVNKEVGRQDLAIEKLKKKEIIQLGSQEGSDVL